MKRFLCYLVIFFLFQIIIVSVLIRYIDKKNANIISPTISPPSKTVVVKVVDGDTFVISGVSSIKGTVRLIGVDTPEIGECFASEAASFAASILLNTEVKVEYDSKKMDQFGRTLAYLYYKNGAKEWTLFNSDLLKNGMGRYFLDTVNTAKNKDLLLASYRGYANKSGLWTQCAANTIIGCVIKGNVGRDGVRYYHLPSFRHYYQTVVNFEKGDMYLCSEKEAMQRGWSKAIK